MQSKSKLPPNLEWSDHKNKSWQRGGGSFSGEIGYLSKFSKFILEFQRSESNLGRLFAALKTERISVFAQLLFCQAEKFKKLNKAVINKKVKSFAPFLRISIKAIKLVKIKAEACLLLEYAYE